MRIILLLTIFTVASAVIFPVRIGLLYLPLVPTNKYIEPVDPIVKVLQDFTADLGVTATYNLTQNGQLLASEGPKLDCGRNLTSQFGSMVSLIATALRRKWRDCPHPKGNQIITREFTTYLIFDDMPAPSCGSKFIIDERLNAPDVKTPILEMSLSMTPVCNGRN